MTFKQAICSSHESELVSHNFLSQWVDERRASVRKEIKLDPKVSDSYIGQYETAHTRAEN